MSVGTDLKTVSCPKCHNKNPADAAFCGFCGADLRSRQGAPEHATMFGYAADFGLDALKSQPQPVQGKDDAPTTAYETGSGYLGERYWLSGTSQPVALGTHQTAKDTKTDRTVEVIVVDQNIFPSALDFERATRELRQLQKVDNEHVVSILDHGKSEDGSLYIVTDVVEGRTWTDVIADGPQSLADVCSVIGNIGAALTAIQSVGIIHRDIAPHNVVITSKGAQLRCYGVAPRIKERIFGTSEYISPEQAAGRPVNQRSNIYSLGAMMFAALSGQAPFVGDADSVLEQQQNNEAPSLRDRVPQTDEKVCALVEKALSKSSNRRHLTLRQFLRDVDVITDALAKTPGEAQPSSAAIPKRQPTQEPAEVAVEEAVRSSVPAAALSPEAFQVLPTSATLVPADGAPANATAQRDGLRVPDQQVVVSEAMLSTIVNEKAPTMIGESMGGTPLGATPQAVEAGAVTLPPQAAPIAGEGDVQREEIAATGGSAMTTDAVTDTVGAQTGNTVVGETRAGMRISMHQTNEESIPPESDDDGKNGQNRTEKAPQKKDGFRETMWFFKGEVDSAMAEKGEPAAPEEAAADPGELSARYKDDGTITDDEARRLSLRTGTTQMMEAVKVPSGHVPGEAMRAEDFMKEMNQGRSIGVIVLIAIGVLVLGGAAWLFIF